jgi:hypothetical protein
MHSPSSRCRGNEHGSRCGPRLSERGPKASDRGGPAGHLSLEKRLRVKRCVGRRGDRLDLIEADVELFGQQSRFRRVDALTHLDARHHQRYTSLPRDADETTECARTFRIGPLGPRVGPSGEGDNEAAYDQFAPGNRQGSGHLREADLIAARMRA